MIIKRILDIVLGSIGVIALSPLLIVCYILELLIHGYPAIYSTKRPGKDCKIFKLYKFRSMTNAKDETGKLLDEKERITKFGRIIRKTSIDELPSLINIIKGDMSIIGPRPLLIEYLELYPPKYKMRHAVRPGLYCGKAKQFNDGGVWTWRKQFENDIFYVENVSLILDIKMILSTLREVFRASDRRSSDTRVPYDGTNLDETRSKYEMNQVVKLYPR